ncbi:MAG TPA: hypothetical protein VE029_01595 [Rhizobacter sp.]|nr:hypothetical protein [Rhizobacter sp.]
MSAPADVQSADGLPRARGPVMIGAATLLLIAGPFIALTFATHWSDFHFASGDVGSIGVSLGYSLISLVLIVALGTPLAWWLARHSFHGKWVLEAIILLALLTPPLAMGNFAHHTVRPLRPGGQPGGSHRCRTNQLRSGLRARAVLRSASLLRGCGPRRV